MIVESHISIDGEDVTLLFYMPAIEEATRRVKSLGIEQKGNSNTVTWNTAQIQAVVYGGYYCTCLLDGEPPKITYRKFGIWVAKKMETTAGINECVAIWKMYTDSQRTEDIPHSPGYEEPEPDEKKSLNQSIGDPLKSAASE